MPGGRKSLREELEITRRYADLSAKAFKLIKKKLDSDDKAEQNFALDWLKGGFARMIPQKTQLGGDPDNDTPVPIYMAKSVNK
jgi:hypothetical protein